MATIEDTNNLYMGVAILHAKLSKAKRAKVGACLVTKNGTILGGVNGTPSGTDNTCEVSDNCGNLTTKKEVIHAELQTVLKAAKEGICVENGKMYVTLSPCLSCSAMMIQAGIKEVFYLEAYRDLSGVQYLQESGVLVHQLKVKE
jgi:dCMP deaminase